MGDMKRNLEVIRMINEGMSRKRICERFGISRTRVGQIIAAFQLEARQREQSRQALEKLRSTNSIDKTWPKEIIMDCLRLPKVFAWRLERHFQKENVRQLSLRDLMDFLIPAHIGAGQNVLEIIPAIRKCHVGSKTYSSLVRCLSQQDLGEAFNAEWALRIANVFRYQKGTHAYVPSVLMDIAISLGLTPGLERTGE